MNIVHVEDFIHPDAGYQLNLLSKLQVKQGHQVTIVTSEISKVPDYLSAFFGKENIETKDERFHELTGVKIIRSPIFGFYSGRAIHYPQIFKTVDSLNPDILFVHGEDTLIGMQYLWRYPKLKYPLVFDCHSVEMASVNKFKALYRMFYKRFMAPIIIANDIPLIRVVDVDFVEKCLGVPLNKTVLLSFGTDTSYFKPCKDSWSKFRADHKINDSDFVVLYAGKLDKHKGGQFFAESIKEYLVTSSGRQIVFVIIGTVADEYGKTVEEIFSKSQNRIIRFPTQAYPDLSSFYQAADLALFPRQCSMSFFEVQSCGVPVVFEDNEINIDRARYGNGFTFRSGDKEDFRSKIRLCADMDMQEFNIMKSNARKYIIDTYDYLPIAQKFTDILEAEVLRFKKKKGL